MIKNFIRETAKEILIHEIPFTTAVTTLRKELIKAALRKTQGNRTHAAALLGIQRATLVAEIKRLRELKLLTNLDTERK